MAIQAKLVEFHKNFKGAKKTGVNPHFRSEYMTLDDLVNAVTPVMNELGMVAYHYVENGELVTVVADDEGESITSRIPMALNGNPQAAGSMVTYYKRYNLGMLLNVVTDADDDGNAAAAATPEPPAMASTESLAALKKLSEGNEEREFWFKNNAQKLNEARAKSIIKVWSEHKEEEAA